MCFCTITDWRLGKMDGCPFPAHVNVNYVPVKTSTLLFSNYARHLQGEQQTRQLDFASNHVCQSPRLSDTGHKAEVDSWLGSSHWPGGQPGHQTTCCGSTACRHEDPSSARRPVLVCPLEPLVVRTTGTLLLSALCGHCCPRTVEAPAQSVIAPHSREDL